MRGRIGGQEMACSIGAGADQDRFGRGAIVQHRVGAAQRACLAQGKVFGIVAGERQLPVQGLCR